MAVLVFIYTQIEPFFLFTLRRHIVDDAISTAEYEKKGVPAVSPNSCLTSPDTDTEDILSVLTEKEKEVAELICLGHTNADIAKLLFISEQTVKTHTKKIYPKMGVHSRLELAAVVSKQRRITR
ncbi:MAG: helix-turn-helix transcriptional regulator [Clostridia bacterium]|nr:helix-turn-helix transcriptional regulator [Clostridia bacterium]